MKLKLPIIFIVSLLLISALVYNFQKRDVVVDGRDFKRDSIYLAVMRHDLEKIKRLAEQGADVNSNEGEFGRTPLHFCDSHLSMEVLLKCGADPDGTDDNGQTPLHKSAASGGATAPDRVAVLLQYGASTSLKDALGCTPLHGAWQPACAQLLIRAGAPLNARENDLCTPLMCMSGMQNTPVVRILLNAGADPNIPDHRWYTPLEKVLAKIDEKKRRDPRPELIKNLEKESELLKSFGALRMEDILRQEVENNGLDPNALDERGMSPMHYAANFMTRKEALKYLISVGGDINVLSANGKTPMDLSWDKDFIKSLGGYKAVDLVHR